jgi:hypothetical protein
VKLLHLAGVDARNADLCTGIERRNLLELGVHAKRVGEQHAAIANQEQARREQHQAANDERADSRQSLSSHLPPYPEC